MIRKEWMNPEGLDYENDFEKSMFHKHFAPYLFIEKFVKGKQVLELGCGAGYGIEFLSKDAKKIVTVDIDNDSLNHAKENSKASNIEYVNQDILDGLSFDDSSFDIVISFQVIEHFTKKEVQFYLKEIYRQLKHGGMAFITTPNREIRLLRFQKPVNKYHPVEYSLASLNRIVNRQFQSVEILGLKSKSEIVDMFSTRKNMKPLQIYIIKPIRRLLVHILRIIKLNSLLNILERRSEYTRPFHRLGIGEISDEFFHFEKEALRESLDFLVICHK